jgi:hypothetical protein
LGVLPDASALSADRGVFGSSIGSSQSMNIVWERQGSGTTWGMGIQADGAGSEVSEFPTTADWTRVCLLMDSTTDTAKLAVNGVIGSTTGVSVKTYTSYTLASNFTIGMISGISSTSMGGTIDDVKIYTSLLTTQEITDDYEAWEAVAPTPTGTYEQKTHKWQRLRKKANGDAEDFTISGTTNGITMSVVVGGAIALITQMDCTVANCDPTGFRLYANKNSGAFSQVGNTGADVMFYGATDVDVVSGTVTCCLTGALTTNDGPTNTTSDAVPVIDLAQNASFVRRSIIKFSSSVTAGDTICFKEYHQTDTPLDSYTPSDGACVTIAAVSAGVGF